MSKRTLLVFTFVAALGAAGFGVSNKAQAWQDCDDHYVAAYSYPAYATYGYGAAWAPRVAYYPRVPVQNYPVYYGHYNRHHDHHHGHHHDGLRISFGF